MNRFFAALFAVASSVGGSAWADTLNWDTVDWTDTTIPYSQTFAVGSTNVTVAITGNVADFLSANGLSTPNDYPYLNGGDGQETLALAVNHAARADSITVTVTFSSFVNNISFSLFDVDADTTGGADTGYRDQIRNITAFDGTNTFAASSVTGGTDNTIAGTGTGITATGISSAAEGTTDGIVNISFGSNAVNSITFTYGNSSAAPTNPGIQWIGFGDVTYTVVPEPSTYFSAVLLGALLVLHQRKRRRFF
jgi:hypothetical protein